MKAQKPMKTRAQKEDEDGRNYKYDLHACALGAMDYLQELTEILGHRGYLTIPVKAELNIVLALARRRRWKDNVFWTNTPP